MPVPWDPDDYRRNASAQTAWAADLLPLLELSGDESVLDLGSGDGHVTAVLAQLVPRGHVVGLDASLAMVGYARKHHASSLQNLEFVLGDMQAIPFMDCFDRVFSSAALHWARDLAAVVDGIARGLRPGGRAVIQCGGAGNATPMIAVMEDLIRSPAWAPYFPDTAFRYSFTDDEAFRMLLLRAGLVPRKVSLIPKTMVLAGRDGLAGWVRTTWLKYTGGVPAGHRMAFVDSLVDGYLARYPPGLHGTVEIPMVRLQAVADRP